MDLLIIRQADQESEGSFQNTADMTAFVSTVMPHS